MKRPQPAPVRHAPLVLLAACLLLAAAAAGHADRPAGNIKVGAAGFRSEKGRAVAALFDSPAGFPSRGDKAFRREEAAVSSGTAVFVFRDVPYGRYAVSVLHDENSNGRLDSSWLGVPREGVGASNDPAARFGPPSFKDSAFELRQEKADLKLTIRYY